MVLRTGLTGPMGNDPRISDARAGNEGENGAVISTRQSRRVQGLNPEFPNTTIPMRKVAEGNKDEGNRREERRDDCDEESIGSNQTSKTVKSNRSDARKKKLLAELQAQEELDMLEEEFERKKLERKKKRIKQRLQIEHLNDTSGSECDLDSVTSNRVLTANEKCQNFLRNQVPSLDGPFPNLNENVTRTAAADPYYQEGNPVHRSQDHRMPMPQNFERPELNGEMAQAQYSSIPNRCELPMQFNTSNQNDAMLSRIDRMLSRQAIPKDLLFFSGEVSEWPMFQTQYCRTTNLLGLSNDENLVRLQKCLKGKARDAVLPILNIPDNVQKIMNTLEIMFGRSDMIIKSMIQKVKMADIPTEEKPETIIAFSNLVANLVATMKSLKKLGHMQNPQLIEDLVTKLPHQLKFRWCTMALERVDDLNLEDFASWLEKIARTYSLMPIIENSNVRIEKVDLSHKNANKKTVLNIVEAVNICCKCKSNAHKLSVCPEFLKLSVKDRWSIVIQNKLCIGCLLKGHRLDTPCPNKKECSKDGCQKVHNPLLHKQIEGTYAAPKNTHGGATSSNWVGCSSESKKDVLLKILPVMLSGPKGQIHTYALFDEGSTITMLDTMVAKLLGANGPIVPLCMEWTNGMEREENSSRKVKIEITAQSGGKVFNLHDVRTVTNLLLPKQSVDMIKLKEDWPHLCDVGFHSIENQRPMILIGQDNNHVTTPNKIMRGPDWAPVATKTPLGWVIHGSSPTTSRSNNGIVLVHACTSNDDLARLIKESYSTENFGVKIIEKPMRSIQDQKAFEILEKTTHRIGERFETGLLWKSEDVLMPDSKPTALRRLRCIERKMDRDPQFAKVYTDKIEDFIVKGYARELSPEELKVEPARTYYMPHFAVTNPNKPGKLRLIFDAASKSEGVSLNDCLLKGPDLLNSLPAILWRFRENPIVIVGDVREMFPQIKIITEDQNAQRFLWRGSDRNNPPKIYMMTSMVFGATCSPSSANWVKIKNAEEFRHEFPRVYESVLKQTFMDDHLDGGSTVAEVANHLLDIIEVYRRGGFCICNWVSNNPNVLEKVSPELRGKGFEDLTVGAETPVERILGLRWKTSKEFFFMLQFHKVSCDISNGERIPTKRQVLALMMSIFDPLGFLSPLVIKIRILFQSICRSGLGWDDELPLKFYQEWKDWLKMLKCIDEFSFHRCYHPNLREAKSIQLHVFTDASLEAYACSAYLRIQFIGEVCTTFVAAKSRVAPLKPLSVPRLELQAAVLGSRLAHTIRQEHNLKIDATHFWTDSKTVLSWIQSETRTFKQFVSHRIGEILESTDSADWHWVPTLQNVADEATRWESNLDLSRNSRWLCAPSYLKDDQECWPKEVEKMVATCEEMRKDYVLLISKSQKNKEFILFA